MEIIGNVLEEVGVKKINENLSKKNILVEYTPISKNKNLKRKALLTIWSNKKEYFNYNFEKNQEYKFIIQLNSKIDKNLHWVNNIDVKQILINNKK